VGELGAGWPHGSQDPIGQAAEFLVWAPLITQSGGGLHVFLPVLDRGLDAVVHRLNDGAYLALQVKGKTSLHGPEAPIAVYEKHLFTPDQLVIGVHLDGDHLGPYVLVADAATFRRKAATMVDRGRVMLVADMPIRPIPGHSWSENLVPLDMLAERLGATSLELGVGLEVAPPSDEDRLIGSWGELEVIRRLAFLEDCGLFRPFPDNETNEILVRRLTTGATIGIQVKTGQLPEPDQQVELRARTDHVSGSPGLDGDRAPLPRNVPRDSKRSHSCTRGHGRPELRVALPPGRQLQAQPARPLPNSARIARGDAR
jgi:hypothetical protein